MCKLNRLLIFSLLFPAIFSWSAQPQLEWVFSSNAGEHEDGAFAIALTDDCFEDEEESDDEIEKNFYYGVIKKQRRSGLVVCSAKNKEDPHETKQVAPYASLKINAEGLQKLMKTANFQGEDLTVNGTWLISTLTLNGITIEEHSHEADKYSIRFYEDTTRNWIGFEVMLLGHESDYDESGRIFHKNFPKPTQPTSIPKEHCFNEVIDGVYVKSVGAGWAEQYNGQTFVKGNYEAPSLDRNRFSRQFGRHQINRNAYAEFAKQSTSKGHTHFSTDKRGKMYTGTKIDSRDRDDDNQAFEQFWP